MPFCSKCGNSLSPSDRFCKVCGTPQPMSASSTKDPFLGIDPLTTTALCYIPFVGWIVSIYVLSADRFRQDKTARFHAFQGLYIFVAWLVYDWVLEGILYGLVPQPRVLSRLVQLAFVLGWIWMVVQTSQRNLVRVPFIAELADKSVNEQS